MGGISSPKHPSIPQTHVDPQAGRRNGLHGGTAPLHTGAVGMPQLLRAVSWQRTRVEVTTPATWLTTTMTPVPWDLTPSLLKYQARSERAYSWSTYKFWVMRGSKSDCVYNPGKENIASQHSEPDDSKSQLTTRDWYVIPDYKSLPRYLILASG